MRPSERLLGKGDRTLFGSLAGIEEAWRIVEPALQDPVPPLEYACGGPGPDLGDMVWTTGQSGER